MAKKAIVPSFIEDAQRAIITQETPPEAIKQRKGKGGKTFNYVEHAWVTEQLNLAFGWGWSWEVIEDKIILDNNDQPREVGVLGKLTVHTPNGDLTKMQYGSADIKRLKETNEPISIFDDYKAASSDALKKCASLLGLALDLYKSDDNGGVQSVEAGVEPPPIESERTMWTPELIQPLVEAGHAPDSFSAAGMLTLMRYGLKINPEDAVGIGKIYRRIRDAGEEDTAKAMAQAKKEYWK